MDRDDCCVEDNYCVFAVNECVLLILRVLLFVRTDGSVYFGRTATAAHGFLCVFAVAVWSVVRCGILSYSRKTWSAGTTATCVWGTCTSISTSTSTTTALTTNTTGCAVVYRHRGVDFFILFLGLRLDVIMVLLCDLLER